MQQLLPFTVLKLNFTVNINDQSLNVATALTVYGIETINDIDITPDDAQVATALTVYGIETV